MIQKPFGDFALLHFFSASSQLGCERANAASAQVVEPVPVRGPRRRLVAQSFISIAGSA
jgi:hypothetical protein